MKQSKLLKSGKAFWRVRYECLTNVKPSQLNSNQLVFDTNSLLRGAFGNILQLNHIAGTKMLLTVIVPFVE